MAAEHKNDGQVFELSGKREVIATAERAAELLKPLLDEAASPVYSRVKISGKSFGVAAAEIVAKAIQRIEGLQIADFADIIASQPEEDAKKVLEIVCNALAKHKLIELNLSDNALGRRGVAACSGALKGQKLLQRLYFSNNGLEGDAAQLIRELLTENIDPAIFTTLHISNNLLRDPGAKQLAELIPKLPNLRDIKIAGTRIQPGGGLALVQSLLSLRHLVSLDLSDNSLGPKSAAVLAQVISNNPELRVLNLSDTGLDETARSILKAIPSVPHLTELNLSFNEFPGSAASKQLADSLKPLTKLTKLSLESSEIGNKGARALLPWLSSHQALTSINLYRNNITSSTVADLSAALSKLKLASLNLNGNRFKAPALAQIRAAYAATPDLLGSLSDNEDDYSQSEEEADEDEAADEDVDDLADELNNQKI